MKHIWILFFTLYSIAQNQTIKIDVNSISDIDSLSFRKFTINYSIKNTTSNRISFFLNPKRVLAGSGGSMNTNISANLFQEKEELPMHAILSFTSKSRELPIGFENLKEGKEKDDILRKYMKDVFDIDIDKELEDIKKNEDGSYRLKKSSGRLMGSIMTLEPFESKQYNKTFYWDKNRYYKINEMEYYINEKSNCFLELFIVLLKEEYRYRMTENDFNTITNTPNFIKGWFTSNKIEINFRE
jgi:hypothetical protein